MTYRASPFRTDDRGLLGPAGPIGPAFSDDLMRMLLGTFHQEDDDEPTPHDLTKWGGALTALEAFQPRTAIEAMLAAQAIATHHCIMECYFRAMQRDIPEELAIRVRANAAGLTRAMDVNLRMLGRLQARPVPPPLPDVPAAVDAVLDLELERARRRAREAAGEAPGVAPGEAAGEAAVRGEAARAEPARTAGDAPTEGPAGPAASAGSAASGAMRPAIVLPRLEPHPPLDKTIMAGRIAALHKEINERLDRERGGTPQEWYARQREEVRLKEEAAAKAKADAGPGPAPADGRPGSSQADVD